MKYTVLIEPTAEEDITEAALWIAESAPVAAQRWQDGLEDAVNSLEDFPHRCSLAPEAETFDYEIRHLLYGNYRILFTIRGSTVHVLHVRHAARRTMTPEDTSDSAE